MITHPTIKMQRIASIICICFLSTYITACDKLVDIDYPTATITTEEAFKDSANATSALLGLYTQFGDRNGSIYSTGFLSANLGMYADELEPTGNISNETFFIGKVPKESGVIWNNVWGKPYNLIFQSNLIIEEVEKSAGISDKYKKQIIGETKFIRAYNYLILVSLFGDVPLILKSDYKGNINVKRTSKSLVLESIIEDLKFAEANLPEDYAVSRNEKIRVNSLVASALLARIYLNNNQYNLAIEASSRVISKVDLYSIQQNTNLAFDNNGKEAILQLYINPAFDPYNATGEGFNFIPDFGLAPRYALREEFINSFEQNDTRRVNWIDSVNYRGRKIYFTKKYKIGPFDTQPNVRPIQLMGILRLPEQFLIRSEANLKLGNIQLSLTDLNVLRQRASLLPTESDNSKDIENLILLERWHEYFSELGTRWFDLTRTGMADEVNSKIKADWLPFRKLLPIPDLEIQRNNALTQNPGYN